MAIGRCRTLLSPVPLPRCTPESELDSRPVLDLPPTTQAQGTEVARLPEAPLYVSASLSHAGARTGQEAAAAAAGPRPDEHPGAQPAHQRHQHAGDGAGPKPRLERCHHGPSRLVFLAELGILPWNLAPDHKCICIFATCRCCNKVSVCTCCLFDISEAVQFNAAPESRELCAVRSCWDGCTLRFQPSGRRQCSSFRRQHAITPAAPACGRCWASS